MAREVFISYSSKDAVTAHMIKGVLERNGIGCWMAPGSIPPGSSYTVEIPRGIKECTVLLLLLSNEAQSSPWVSKEVDTAISNGKVIIPFMITECDIAEAFEFMLSNVQRWNAYESMSENLEKLVKQIHGILGVKKKVDVKSIEKQIAEQQSMQAQEGPAVQQVAAIPVASLKSGKNHKAEEKKYDEKKYPYDKTEDGVIITGVPRHRPSKLTIPEEIDGMKVVGIASRAFFACDSLREITIPSGVTTIGSGAFWGCVSLERIIIPEGVKRIGSRAFFSCDNLKAVELPNSLVSIGSGAFFQCCNMSSVTVPASVTNIGDLAFGKSGTTLYVSAGSYAEVYAKHYSVRYKTIQS